MDYIQTVPKEAQTLDFLDKEKSAIPNIFKQLKKTMSKEIKERMSVMSHKINNINKEIIVEQNQIQIMTLKATISVMKIH